MFPTKILLGIDGSEEARRAARLAMTLAESLDSELHLVHVDPMWMSAYAYPELVVYDPDLQVEVKAAERAARERLKVEMDAVGGLDNVADTHVAMGRPDAEIVRVAEEIGAGLVVVGSRGLGLIRRAVMGGVSTSVVRHAHSPVLVVRGDQHETDDLSGRVLLAIDGSEEANSAAQAAVEISNATGSELHLIFALQTEERAPYSHPLMGERWEASLDQAKHKAREFVDEQARRIEEKGGKVKDVHLAFGKPDEEIVKLGEELEAGMIVMGSRGLGGVRRALMGGVSDSVVRHAHCPVLVVRTEDARHETSTASGGEDAMAL